MPAPWLIGGVFSLFHFAKSLSGADHIGWPELSLPNDMSGRLGVMSSQSTPPLFDFQERLVGAERAHVERACILRIDHDAGGAGVHALRRRNVLPCADGRELVARQDLHRTRVG